MGQGRSLKIGSKVFVHFSPPTAQPGLECNLSLFAIYFSLHYIIMELLANKKIVIEKHALFWSKLI